MGSNTKSFDVCIAGNETRFASVAEVKYFFDASFSFPWHHRCVAITSSVVLMATIKSYWSFKKRFVSSGESPPKEYG